MGQQFGEEFASIGVNFSLHEYRKNSKNWDTQNNYRSCPYHKTVWFYNAVVPPKDVDRMANNVDPDQTAP